MPCVVYDPRCTSCDAETCLQCTDPLLLSIRRSGQRDIDPPLPFDEHTRQLSRTLPFGTQSPYAFEEAELFFLKTDEAQLRRAGVEHSEAVWWGPGTPYTMNTGAGIQDPYTQFHPLPDTVLPEGYYEQYIASFHAERGLTSNGSVPESTLLALQERRNANASTAASVSVPWFHNVTRAFDGIALLKDSAVACGQGTRSDATFDCAAFPVSHVLCGHPGTLQWASPKYIVWEGQSTLRVAVRRSGGGLGKVTLRYELRHETTCASDVTSVAHYTSSQELIFEEGMVMVSFLVTINDDVAVEGNETFALVLLEPTGGASLGPQAVTQVTILDEDGGRLQPTATVLTGTAIDAGSAVANAGDGGNARDGPVLAGTAGIPLTLLLHGKNAANDTPAEGAGAWSWTLGGEGDDGEVVDGHRWLLEVWDEAPESAPGMPTHTTPVGPGIASAPDWSRDRDTFGHHPFEEGGGGMPVMRGGVQKGMVLSGVGVVGTLRERVRPNGSAVLGGLDIGMTLNLTSPAAPEWSALAGRGAYLGLVVSEPAGHLQTHLQHAKRGGLLGEYYTNAFLSGTPAITRVDATVNFTLGGGQVAARATDYTSTRWTGAVVLGRGGELDAALDWEAEQGEVAVNFAVLVGHADQVRLWVDHTLIIDTWGDVRVTAVPESGVLGIATLQLHTLHHLRLEWRHTTGEARCQLLWAYNTTGLSSVAGVPPSVMELTPIPHRALFSLRHVGGSPIPTTIQPAPPSAGTVSGMGSILLGAGLNGGIAGKPVQFEVLSRDMFGNFRGGAAFNDTFQVKLRNVHQLNKDVLGGAYGAGLSSALFADHPLSGRQYAAEDLVGHWTISFNASSSTHIVTYIAHAAGNYRLDVLLWEPEFGRLERLRESPSFLSMVPAAPSVDLSMFAGPGTEGGTAGQACVVYVRLRDVFGNLAIDNAESSLTMQGVLPEAGEIVSGSLRWQGGADYAGEWTPTVAGNYSLFLRVQDVNLQGTPLHNISIIPSASSAAHSFATGSPLVNMTATLPHSFNVHVRDEFENVRTSASGALDIGLDTITASMLTFPWPELNVTVLPEQYSMNNSTGQSVIAIGATTAQHVEDELYAVTLRPMAAGIWPMHVRLNGAAVSGSPFLVLVVPGPSVGFASWISKSPATMGGRAGQQLEAYVQVRDGAGNDVWGADDVVSGEAELVQRASGSDERMLEGGTLLVMVDALGGGLYRVTYTPVVAGTYHLNVQVNGEALKNGTVRNIVVLPALAVASSTVTTGSALDTRTGWRPLQVGQPLALKFRMRDAFGNDVPDTALASRLQTFWQLDTASTVTRTQRALPGSPYTSAAEHVGGGVYGTALVPEFAGAYDTETVLAPVGAWDRTVFAQPEFVRQVSRGLDPNTSWSWGHGGPAEVGNASAWSATWEGVLMAETSTYAELRVDCTGVLGVSVFEAAESAFSAHSVTAEMATAATDPDRRTNTAKAERLQVPFYVVAGKFYRIRVRLNSVPRGETSLAIQMLTPRQTDHPSTEAAWGGQSLAPSPYMQHLHAPGLARLVAGSMARVQAVHGPALPSVSHAEGIGLQLATVLAPASAVVTALDEFGNVVTDDVNVTCSGVLAWSQPLPGDAPTSPVNTEPEMVTVHALGGGRWQVQYVPMASGVHVLHVFLNAPAFLPALGARGLLRVGRESNADVVGSPFAVTVHNAAAAAGKSSASGGGLEEQVAGEGGEFFVQTRDAGGNNLSQPLQGGVHVQFRAHGSVLQPPAAVAIVSYLQHGRYRVQSAITVAGSIQVHVSVAGAALAGSPFTVRVLPNLAHASNCEAKGLVPKAEEAGYSELSTVRWVVGEDVTFNVVLFDTYSNRLQRGGDALVVRLVGVDEPVTDTHETLNTANFAGMQLPDTLVPATALGSYSSSVRLQVPGRYLVHVELASGTAGRHGLTGEYFDNRHFRGTPRKRVVDSTLHFLWRRGGANATEQGGGWPPQASTASCSGAAGAVVQTEPLAQNVSNGGAGSIAGFVWEFISVRWTGFIEAPQTADYTLHTWANDGVRVYVEGALVVDALHGAAGYSQGRVPFPLRAGQLYHIQVEYWQGTGDAWLSVGWAWSGRKGVASDGVQALPPHLLYAGSTPIAGSPFVIHTQ